MVEHKFEQEKDLKERVLVKTSQKCQLDQILIKNGQSNQIEMPKYDWPFKENILKITIYISTLKLFEYHDIRCYIIQLNVIVDL